MSQFGENNLHRGRKHIEAMGYTGWLQAILDQGTYIKYDRNMPCITVMKCFSGMQVSGQQVCGHEMSRDEGLLKPLDF